MQTDASELSDKVSKADIIKGIGRSIKRAARYYAPYAFMVVVMGGTCGGFAAKIKYEVDHMSPELKSCYHTCYERYKYDINRLKEIDEEHDCSSDWWVQSTNDAQDSRMRCIDRCYEKEGKKEIELK